MFAIDKRKTERLPLNLKLYYNIPPDTGRVGPVYLSDISGGGVRFENPTAIPYGTEINLKLFLPNESPIVIQRAIVVWCKKVVNKNIHYIGIKFTNMTYEDRRKLVEFMCEMILNSYLNENGEIIKNQKKL